MTNCGFADANDDRDWNALDDVLKSSQSESSESEGGEKTGNPMNYWENQPKAKGLHWTLRLRTNCDGSSFTVCTVNLAILQVLGSVQWKRHISLLDDAEAR